ncbi:MAG: AtpZ/AtpI family protein [Spirochaetota bacterium]|nr:AtpZ/AtpI family protein [Spirochaetota bacterium]
MHALTYGIQFVIIIFMFLGIGYWIDKKLETTPLFIIIFVFIGFGIALYTLIKSVNQLKK